MSALVDPATRRRMLSGAGPVALALAVAPPVLNRVRRTLRARIAERWAAAMADAAPRLLPGGQVHGLRVTDEATLNAGRRARVLQTVVHARSRDGHPVTMVINGYDRHAEHADEVSWRYEALPLAPGWEPVPWPTDDVDGDAQHFDLAERQVDGRLLRVAFTAALRGDQVEVAAGHLTVDGEPVPLPATSAAVRAAVEPVLAPRTFAAPLTGAAVAVQGVGVDGTGVRVVLEAVQVDVTG